MQPWFTGESFCAEIHLPRKAKLTAKLLLNAVSHLNVEHRNTVSYKSLCTDFTQTIITVRQLSQLYFVNYTL